ncbi:MAG: tetratricopeptide repeat protein [Bacteroidota bacterium]|nr:tetratricopeptide repeat protein [Bacteroidota bacterium]MDP4230777.1 tetratricopeptide repeat protein [Bacteroidota bacterium]
MIRSQKKLKEAAAPQEKLSQSEELLVAYHKSSDWIKNNSSKAIGVGVVIVALIAGVFYWRSKQADNSEHAEIMLSRVVGLYQSGEWRKAIDGDAKQRLQNEPLRGLKEIASEYGSTRAGQIAKLYLGNAYYYLGKLDSAMQAFNDASEDGPLLKAAVESGKATIFEDKGNKEEAAKLFIRAASIEKINPMNADYSLAAARNYEQAGKKDEAIKIYRKLLEDYPGTQFDDAAKRELLKMGVIL